MKSQYQGIYKVIYLILLSTVLFFIQDWWVLGAIFVFQCLLWLITQTKTKPLIRSLFKLKWFFLIIILSYTLIPPGDDSKSIELNLYFFSLNLYLSGFYMALLMLSRVGLMLMTSLWVRLSSSQEQFIAALRSLKIPATVAIVIDLTLSQMSKKKNGKKKKNKEPKESLSLQEVKENKAQFIDRLIEKNQQKSEQILQQNYPDMEPAMRKDVLVILSVVVAIMSLKLLQMLPGLPFAPGHKNLLIIPLIMLASLATHSKYGGLAAGFATGMVSFFMGFGKFGVLEILHFALPGLVADLLSPFIHHAKGKMILAKLALMGALIGLTRFVANFSVLILAGSPKLAWVVFFPMLISQIIFGALSSFVCLIVIKKHFNGGWFK